MPVNLEELTEEQVKALVTKALEDFTLADRIQVILLSFEEKDDLEELKAQVELSIAQIEEDEEDEADTNE